MPGNDPVYAAARSVLLDALAALGPHRKALTLVGAQAIYIRVGEADIAVAPTTTDGDLAFDPHKLSDEPAIEVLLHGAGFAQKVDATHGALPGIWEKKAGSGYLASVDLLMPAVVASRTGRRAARLRGHQTGSVLKVGGLEGALVDADIMTVRDDDGRSINLRVAGPAALLVAKVHKIVDRTRENDRLKDKDALDVFRLLRGTDTANVAERARRLLADERSRKPAAAAFDRMPDLFGRSESRGVRMAIRGSGGLMSSSEVSQSLMALTQQLNSALRSG